MFTVGAVVMFTKVRAQTTQLADAITGLSSTVDKLDDKLDAVVVNHGQRIARLEAKLP